MSEGFGASGTLEADGSWRGPEPGDTIRLWGEKTEYEVCKNTGGPGYVTFIGAGGTLVSKLIQEVELVARKPPPPPRPELAPVDAPKMGVKKKGV